MGVIYEPKHSVKGETCTCETPEVNEYDGSPYKKNEGYFPDVGLIWQCDDCGQYWKVIDKPKIDYRGSYHGKWSGRKFVPVEWYHWISWGRINKYKKEKIKL